MDINRTLIDEIGSSIYDYGSGPDEIKSILAHQGSFIDRQKKAINVVENIMTSHGKSELLKYVVELARIEMGIRELEPWVRDHVVHALLCFSLGIYINERFFKPIIGISVDSFQWKLAGLFHDVGYPLQVAKDIMKSYASKVNEIKNALKVDAPDVYVKVVPVNLDILTNGINSFRLIQDRLDTWGLQIDAQMAYQDLINSGNICHGMVSALSVLYVIDLMYHKYNPTRQYKDIYVGDNINWNQKYFDEDVISACSAIYIHNLPGDSFVNKKIDRNKAPLAYLLRLSDCLQDWERPSMENHNGLPSSLFDIRIEERKLILQAEIPEKRKDKIREEILSSLIAPDIRIE